MKLSDAAVRWLEVRTRVLCALRDGKQIDWKDKDWDLGAAECALADAVREYIVSVGDRE